MMSAFETFETFRWALIMSAYWGRLEVPRFNPSCHPYAREGQAVV
jgi:hypothetical protein